MNSAVFPIFDNQRVGGPDPSGPTFEPIVLHGRFGRHGAPPTVKDHPADPTAQKNSQTRGYVAPNTLKRNPRAKRPRCFYPVRREISSSVCVCPPMGSAPRWGTTAHTRRLRCAPVPSRCHTRLHCGTSEIPARMESWCARGARKLVTNTWFTAVDLSAAVPAAFSLTPPFGC